MSTVTILHEVHIKTCNLIKKVLLIIGERRNLGTVACVGKVLELCKHFSGL